MLSLEKLLLLKLPESGLELSIKDKVVLTDMVAVAWHMTQD